jgi:hypothetical protein
MYPQMYIGVRFRKSWGYIFDSPNIKYTPIIENDFLKRNGNLSPYTSLHCVTLGTTKVPYGRKGRIELLALNHHGLLKICIHTYSRVINTDSHEIMRKRSAITAFA